MPQFGAPNEPATFPSWVGGGRPLLIGRHPHPGTNRIDGRLCWPSDSLYRSQATRVYGRLYWDFTQPPVPNQPYPQYENVWFDFVATAAREATGWTGLTSSGRSALVRLRHYDALPRTGVQGTEIYLEFFRDGRSIGLKTIEYADDTFPWQFNSSLGEGGMGESDRNPAEALEISANEWAKLTFDPVSECWRFWDTHRLAQCVHEVDPNGMAPIKIKITDFGWGDNFFGPGSTKTQGQKDFEDRVRSEHILTPVYHSIQGWIPCYLEYKSPFFYDADAADRPNTIGMYYGYALRFIFTNNTIGWDLHVRTWSAQNIDPFWETPVNPVYDSGTFFFLGINGSWFTNFIQLAGQKESRNIEQYGIVDDLWPRFTPITQFGLEGFDPIRLTLCSTTAAERGIAIPAQGPLDMPKADIRCLRHTNGNTKSMSSSTYMELGGEVYDLGGWYQPGVRTDGVVVPAGVEFIRATCNVNATSGGGSLISQIRLNNNVMIGGSQQREALGFNGEKYHNSSTAIIPVTAGDQISVLCQNSGESFSGNDEENWLFVEAITPEIEPVSFQLVNYDEAIPGATTQLFGIRIPPSLDGYKITHIAASLGQAQSTSGDVSIHLDWLRQVGRVFNALTNDPIVIEENEWTTDSATVPPSIAPAGDTASVGDIIMATVLSSGAGALGLIIDIDLQQQQ